MKALRKATAAALYKKIAEKPGTPERADKLAECVLYDRETYFAEFKKEFEAYATKKDNDWWNQQIPRDIAILVRSGVLAEGEVKF